jgi:hypothetical protein
LKKRAEERAEVDLQKEEHLPGSRASTVHANIFDECFTVLLKSRTSFSVFLRSMFASCAAARAAPLGQVWPMPLPYPEVHTSRRSRLKECGPLKVCTNYVVAVLSWLHLGEKRKPTEELGLGLGTKLNRDQWKAVHRMQPLFSTWLDGGTVTPEDMGRTAAKVESIEAVLARLEEVAEEVKEGLGGYKGCRRSHKPAFSFEEEHEAEVLGRVGSNLEHVAKDIEPHRLKFVGEPSFDPTPFLDYANREQYNRPLDLSFEESLEDLDLPRVKVRCKRGQGVQLLEKLDSVKRLALVPLKEVREHLLNGMFCLPKDQHRDRMILDARRPNAVEASERRWVYSLGSTCQLNHIHLKEDEILLIHAEDLREFYHCFLVSEQRCRRNGLQMKVKPEEVQHLQCFEAWMAAEDYLVPCLATMAMGDTNAVAFGQCAHLSVILRTNVFELEDFLTLKQRPNRKSIKCGLMIDDFVVLEVHKGQEAPCKEDAETEGRKRMLKVREAYVEAGLPRHEGKAVEQEEKGEFWGYEVDGKRGLARPSLKRLIPLCFILCRVVALGKISVGLLEVIAGALVAAFQCRRRLMSALQEVYRAQRGRSRAEVVRMSMKLKEELLVCLGLLPLAVVDMRLRPSAKLVCSDASTECEAAVQAEVGEARTTEFQRHGLQKGLWNRLTSPSQAYLREKGLGGEESELPGEVSYSMHPLWEVVVKGCQFRTFGRPKKTKSRRHINLKEISAALEAERRMGRESPSSYYVHLQDSQVSLACFVKGRSSSAAVNELLRQSLPEHCGTNVRGYYGYCRSSLNPADDPTRKAALRKPSICLPAWWGEIAEGDFEQFDDFLFQHGVHTAQSAELPSADELLPDLELDWRNSRQLKSDRGRNLRKRERKGASDSGRLTPDSCSSAPSEPARLSSSSEQTSSSRRTAVAVSGEEGTTSGRAGRGSEGNAERRVPPDNSKDPCSSRAGAALTGTRLDVLCLFDHSQFVYDKTRFESLAEAVSSGPGLLDLYSGARGFSKALVRLGCPWAVCFDLKHSIREDLSNPLTQRTLLKGLSLGWFLAMAASPVCASFSTAITPPWRTKLHPGGKPGLTEVQQLKVQLGQEQLAFVLELVSVCLQFEILFWVENPDQSWFWKQQGELSWDKLSENYGDKLGDFRCDQCRFGTLWRKRTRFRTSCHLKGQKEMCCCNKPHVVLRGRDKSKGMNFTKLAESYPRRLCSFLAGAFAIDLELQGKCRKLDLAGCAKVTHCRIGEAENPGPRNRVPRADRNIYDFNLLEPGTILMRARFWKKFQEWAEANLGEGAAGNLAENPGLLVSALEAFGADSFSAGMPLLYFRQLVVHVQSEFPATRAYASALWALISRWEIAEPTQHRTPIPESLVRAMASLSILWGWRRFASTILLCFYGICRIGEVLKAKRCDLLTPEDLLWEDPDVVYLRINVPKSRGRGPKVQYATCKVPSVVKLLCKTWQRMSSEELLCGSSPSSFRRRWDALLKHLGVDKKLRLTPGSLRGGGAVAAHKRGQPIQDLMWNMRLQHQKTLGYYLQEVTAASILPSLTAETRSRIQLLRDAFEFLVS